MFILNERLCHVDSGSGWATTYCLDNGEWVDRPATEAETLLGEEATPELAYGLDPGFGEEVRLFVKIDEAWTELVPPQPMNQLAGIVIFDNKIFVANHENLWQADLP